MRQSAVLVLADWALIVFHTGLVLFNLSGWAWRRTRRLHAATMAATLGSWLLLGICYGTGYCICTDLHWRVRAANGQIPTEDSYVQYLVAKLTGWMPDAALAANASLAAFTVSAILSIYLNVRDIRLDRKRRSA